MVHPSRLSENPESHLWASLGCGIWQFPAIFCLVLAWIWQSKPTEEAFKSSQQKSLSVVYGECADEEGYHYYPQLEQVRAWVREAEFRLIEETFGDLYQHFLVQKK